MNLYRFDRDLKIVEGGVCDLARALQTLQECYGRGLKTYTSGEEAICDTSFGLQVSRDDFIEISCSGLDSIRVHSDRLFSASRLARMFSGKLHLEISGNLNATTEVIRDYTELPREQFEEKYKAFACR